MPNKLEFEGLALLALAFVFAVMAGLIHYYRAELLVVQAQFDGFKATVAAQGKQAEAEAKLRETQYANQITVANASRDDAYKRVQLAETAIRAASSRVPYRAIAASADGSKCIDPSAIAPAIEKFRRDVAEVRRQLVGIVASGDEAQADAKTLITAWPAASPQTKP